MVSILYTINVSINSVIYCYSFIVIYASRCPCGLLYGWETSKELRTRICEHHSPIRRGDVSNPAAQHCIEQIQFLGRGGDIDVKRKSTKTFWIFTLDTLFSEGVNQEIDYTMLY